MPEGMVFPYDFGFFPKTRGDDGDPLDVLILTDEPTFPGCQIDDLEPMVLKQIEDFFVNYQKVRQEEVSLLGRDDAAAAERTLDRASKRYSS